VPVADEITRGFWDSIRAHRLSIQRCQSCFWFNHPPDLICASCGSEHLAYVEVSGRGRLYSYTTVHDPPAPGFHNLVPFLIGVVELIEQPRLLMVTNLVEMERVDVRLGCDLQVIFDDLSPICTLPQFRPMPR
jgi:uncharacterized OB-fold protein